MRSHFSIFLYYYHDILNNVILRVDIFVLVSFHPHESVLVLIEYSNIVYVLGLVSTLCFGMDVKWSNGF